MIISNTFPSILKIIQYPQQRIDNINLRLRLSLRSTFDYFNQKFLGISKLFRKDLLLVKSDNNNKTLILKSQLLETNFRSFLKSSESRLNLSTGILMAISHESVLKRGFAIVKDKDLKLVRSSDSLEKNQSLKIFFGNDDIVDVNVNKGKT